MPLTSTPLTAVAEHGIVLAGFLERPEAGSVMIRQSIIRLQLVCRRGRWSQLLYEAKGEEKEVK
jgi:hypothetical protein